LEWKNVKASTAQNHKSASEGFTTCIYKTSLSQDRTSDQESLPKKLKKTLSQVKKERNLQESNRGGSLSPDRSKRCHVYRMESLQSYNTFNEYDRNV